MNTVGKKRWKIQIDEQFIDELCVTVLCKHLNLVQIGDDDPPHDQQMKKIKATILECEWDHSEVGRNVDRTDEEVDVGNLGNETYGKKQRRSKKKIYTAESVEAFMHLTKDEKLLAISICHAYRVKEEVTIVWKVFSDG